MNIEQRNMFFMLVLVLTVLVASIALIYSSLSRHIDEMAEQDIEQAWRRYLSTQRTEFSRLLDLGKMLRSSSGLKQAMIMRDRKTLTHFLNRSLQGVGIDVMLVYYGRGLVRSVGVARDPVFTTRSVIESLAYRRLLNEISNGSQSAFGHAVVYNHLLRLAAIPLYHPAGGRLGILLLGSEMTPQSIKLQRSQIRSEIMLIINDRLVMSTIGKVSLPQQVIRKNDHGPGNNHFKINGKHWVAYARPVMDHPNGQAIAKIVLAVNMAQYSDRLASLLTNSIVYIVLLILIAGLLAIYQSRYWITRPLKMLADAASKISAGRRITHVKLDRKDEIGDLARSINDMLDRLQDSRQEEELTRQRFRDFAESTSDWLWETDNQGRFTYVSDNVVNVLGMSASQFIGKRIDELFAQESVREFSVQLGDGRASKTPIKDLEVWLTNSDGIRLCIRMNAVPVHDGNGFCGYRGSARDITRIKHNEERLLQLANRDHLTGLANRSRFIEDLTLILRTSVQEHRPGAVLLIDIDHFKLVNDTAGHAAGDEVIVQVGSLLRRLAWESDLVARLSGDEFVICLIDAPLEVVIRKAEEVLTNFSQLRPTYGGKILNITTSIGIALFGDQEVTAAEMLARADAAMYAAKNAGRNRYHIYREGDKTQELMGSQLIWKERIHEAIQKDGFVLAFQPIVSSSGDFVGRYEALVRMKAETGGLHMPGSFIPTAEQFGLIREIDRIVVRKALACMADERFADYTLSINLSGLSVGDADMLELINQELERHGVERNRVIFEVTESAACDDISAAIEFINQIQSLGCRIALDDFGVGFSSFTYLKHLHADILKIDGSFIRDITNSHEDQLFVKALVDVARGMGMTTVAEFVESRECMQRLHELGVDYLQGYYIGKPAMQPEKPSMGADSDTQTGAGEAGTAKISR